MALLQLDPMVATHRLALSLNLQDAAVRHGVSSVHGKVQERHFQSVRVGLRRRQAVLDNDVYVDRGPECGANQPRHARHKRVEVHRAGCSG